MVQQEEKHRTSWKGILVQMFHVRQAFYRMSGDCYRTNVPRKDDVFLMNNRVMVITSHQTKGFRLGEEETKITSLGGQEPYNSSQTQSSDAVSSEFLYLSKPVSEQGVRDSLTKPVKSDGTERAKLWLN
jgi:hypothetical protein